MTRIDRNETAPYYFTYIDKVPGDDVMAVLIKQAEDFPKWLLGISEEKSLHRYAAGKWSLREVLNHVNDGERVFQHRAFWFARGFPTPLPSFDQDIAVAHSGADKIPWKTLVEEFRTIRNDTLAFFRNLPEEAWMRRGIASDNPFTVRSLAYIVAGHVEHHAQVIREKYL